MVMEKKVKALWVATLKSGVFTKGKYQLRDIEDCYDATGVLCELAVSAGVIPQPRKYDRKGSEFFGYRYGDPDSNDGHATGLPEAVQAWSGVDYRTGYKVAMMGDKGKSFDKIAEWIEENL